MGLSQLALVGAVVFLSKKHEFLKSLLFFPNFKCFEWKYKKKNIVNLVNEHTERTFSIKEKEKNNT